MNNLDILVLWHGNYMGSSKGLTALSKLKKMKCNIKMCVEMNYYDDNSEIEDKFTTSNHKFVNDIEELVNNYSIIFMPTISLELVDQIKNVNTDNLMAYLLLFALSKRKKVILLDSAIDIIESDDKPYFIRSTINKRFETMRSMGINIVKLSELCDYIKSIQFDDLKKNNIISEKDIITLFNNGVREIFQNPKDIITPLAKDFAKENNIRIIKGE